MMTLKTIGCLFLLIEVMMCNSSCKTIEPGATASTQQGQNVDTYTILIRLQDNGGALNQVTDKIQRMVFPLNVQVVKSSTFFDNMKEVQVITDAISENQVNTARTELYKIAGVMMVNIYKN